jgi:hypothetical protein
MEFRPAKVRDFAMKNTRISAALVAVILMGMAPSAYAAVNTAPVLDATKSPSLNGVAEDTGAPSSGTDGTQIFSLVDAAAPAGQADNVTDPDPFVQFGIAITAVDTSHYTAWYVYDGATWTSFSGVSESNALLLPANASYRIYGVPAANVSGSQSSAITFRAWDQTSGTSGTTADTTTNGGSTAFSTSTDTISQYISGVNDAPTLDFSRSPQLTSLTEDSGVPTSATDGTLISTLVDFVAPSGQVDNVTDPDPSAALGIAVTHLATAGIAYWYVYDGTNWSLAPTVSTTNALLLPADGSYRLCAVPQANVTGTINAVTFRAWDQTSGTAGSTADTTTNGGTTAFSSAWDTASLVITPVNDAPALVGGATLNAITED